MTRLCIAISLIVLSLGCKPSASDEAIPQQAQTTVETMHDLPPLPPDLYQRYRDMATGVDYIFHELPFSVNQTEKASIMANFSYISPEKAAPLPTSCSPMGREFFQADGDIYMEADVYFSQGCAAYVFYIDKAATYANKISPEGVKFYTQLLRGVQVSPPGQG